jgi:hypothetical protein
MLSGLRSTRRIEHQEQVHITDHLEELRNRIIISLLALSVGFGLCFWQHERIIEFLNRPLPAGIRPLRRCLRWASWARCRWRWRAFAWPWRACGAGAGFEGEWRLALPPPMLR